VDLTSTDALAVRLRSLLLTPIKRPADVASTVEWFGAMQAQDLASGLWSLGVRLPGSTQPEIEAALERREALRTWPMRGTVHLVPGADAAWMLDVMGSRALAGAAKRRETLGLTAREADKAVELLEATLRGGNRLTRSECLAALADGGIEVTGQRGYHLLWYASQQGVTCLAPNRGKEATFVLLHEWVPGQRTPDRDEALATIALRYFRSHGPATRADLARWTGLTMTDAKKGIAAVADSLTTVTVDGTAMLCDPALLDPSPSAGVSGAAVSGSAVPETADSGVGVSRVGVSGVGSSGVGFAGVGAGEGAVDGWVALPGFDEYMLGYKDRTLLLDAAHFDAVVPGGNGVFQSTLVHNGRVAATWKRTLTKKSVRVDITPLVPIRPAARRFAEAALAPYATFVGLPLEPRWP
jgi:hypothetical protein